MLGKADWSKIVLSALQCVVLSHLHALCVHIHACAFEREGVEREGERVSAHAVCEVPLHDVKVH